MSNDVDTWYELDGQDRIVGIGGQWRMDGFDRYIESRVGRTLLGSCIHDHVSGHFTRRFLREFFENARKSGSVIRRNYRCDAPELKRLMEMRVEKRGRDGLWVGHRALDEQPTPFAIKFLTARDRRADYTLRCSMCNRLQSKNDPAKLWGEAETRVSASTTVPVIYTVCPDCRSGLLEKGGWGFEGPNAAMRRDRLAMPAQDADP